MLKWGLTSRIPDCDCGQTIPHVVTGVLKWQIQRDARGLGTRATPNAVERIRESTNTTNSYALNILTVLPYGIVTQYYNTI